MNTFAERQEELAQLDMMLDRKSKKLKKSSLRLKNFQDHRNSCARLSLPDTRKESPSAGLPKLPGCLLKK